MVFSTSQVGFSTMSALALQPMMCYQHPNGQHSLLKHAGVFCNTREHLVMLLAGATLLTFIVATFVGICGWAAWKIPRWSVIFPQRIPAFAFLISRFRMAIRRSRAIRRTREALLLSRDGRNIPSGLVRNITKGLNGREKQFCAPPPVETP